MLSAITLQAIVRPRLLRRLKSQVYKDIKTKWHNSKLAFQLLFFVVVFFVSGDSSRHANDNESIDCRSVTSNDDIVECKYKHSIDEHNIVINDNNNKWRCVDCVGEAKAR